MWVKFLVRFVLMLQFAVLSTQLERVVEDDVELSSLPSIWDDEVVSRMVRDVLAQDLAKQHEHRLMRRQHKRDVYSTASSIVVGSSPRAHTTRKVAATTQKAKKPTKVVNKVTQAGNKNKNRVTQSTATTSTTTKATVKPSTKPIVTNSNSGVSNSANLSKVKVRRLTWLVVVVVDDKRILLASFPCQNFQHHNLVHVVNT